MSYALVFYLGVILGTFLGVGIMCLLAISKESSADKKFPRPSEECSISGPSGPGS